MSDKKKKTLEISRREFFKDAGLFAAGAAIGAATLSVAGAPKEVTKIVTVTAPGTTTTVTVTPPATGPQDILNITPQNVDAVKAAVNNDPEWKLASRWMTQTLYVGVGTQKYMFKIVDGTLTDIKTPFPSGVRMDIILDGPPSGWHAFLGPVFTPRLHRLAGAVNVSGGIDLRGDSRAFYTWYWSLTRMFKVINAKLSG